MYTNIYYHSSRGDIAAALAEYVLRAYLVVNVFLVLNRFVLRRPSCVTVNMRVNNARSFTKKLTCLQDEKFEIVQKSRPLDYPGEGYFSINPGQEILRQFHDMSFSEDLVPGLVKLKLKEALKNALEFPKHFNGEFAINLK